MLYIYQLECLSASDQDAFIKLADRAREAVCLIMEEDLEKTVDECLETLQALDARTFTPQEKHPGTPFLLMDMDALELDNFLDLMRKEGIYIGQKCKPTENNRQWTLKKLITDVAAEHALMTSLMSLQQTLEIAAGFNEEHYAPGPWRNFVTKRDEAAALLAKVGQEKLQTETVRAHTKALNHSLKTLIVTRGGKS